MTSLFVARMVKRRVWCRNILKEAGLFFTRSIHTINTETDQEQMGTEKAVFTPEANNFKIERQQLRAEKSGFKPKADKKAFGFFRPKQEKLVRISLHQPFPLEDEASVGSMYSDFVTESSSTSTLPVEEVADIPKPTLVEIMRRLALNILDNGLNAMYATREREIVYDEAHLYLMRSIQVAVETKWNPIIDDISELVETMIDNIRSLAEQRHRMKLKSTNKVNRLKNNYRGFSSEESQPPTKPEILEVLGKRKCLYNRYPKDAFGVYISPQIENNLSETSELSEYEFYSFNSLECITPPEPNTT